MGASGGDLPARLSETLGRLNVLLRQELAREGVSLAAARTLGTLDRAGPRRLTELAALQQVTQPSMSTLVTRLAGQGLVTRSSNDADGRLVIVAITDRGRALVRQIYDRRARMLSASLAALPAGHRETIAAALPALQDLLSVLEGGDAVAAG